MKADLLDVALYKNHIQKDGKLSESSIYVYTEVLKKFLEKNPNVDDLESYNNFLIEGSIKKRNYHYYYALSKYIDFKIENKDLKEKLIKSIIKPSLRTDIKRERKYLDEDTIMEIINALNVNRHRIIAIIQTLTGVRARDILSIKNGGIMFEDYNNKPTLRINITGKGHRRNVIFIHDEIGQQLIMDYITTHPCVRDFYFCSGNVRKREKNDNEFRFLTMNYWRYWDDLKKALDMKGLNFNDFATHDFRRCFARRVWTKYKDIQVLKNILNHKDVNTTLRYLEQSGLKNIDYHYEMQTNN